MTRFMWYRHATMAATLLSLFGSNPTTTLAAPQAGPAIEVSSLANKNMEVAAGNVLQITVPLTLRSADQVLISTISLLDNRGRVARRFVKRIPEDLSSLPFTAANRSSINTWQLRMPKDIQAGTYSVRYEIALIGSSRSEAGAAFITDGARSDIAKDLIIGKITVSPYAGLLIGQHFHRIPGSSEDGPILVPYHFVRSLNSDLVGMVQWWTGAKTLCEARTPAHCHGKSDEDWRAFDTWADYHAKAGEKKLLVTFSGTPAWASARPKEGSPYCDACGFTAEPAPKYLRAYQEMVARTVERYRSRLMGTECWNEPVFDAGGRPLQNSYFSGTSTSLADVCKAIYLATKSVSPAIPVFCPQPPSPGDLKTILSARTTKGEPLHQFCDVIGTHAYNAVGKDEAGRDYASTRIADVVAAVRATALSLNIDKPLAITEWGIDANFRLAPPRHGDFQSMSASERGKMIYQTLATLQELGVKWIALYAYDDALEGLWQGRDSSTRQPIYASGQAEPMRAAFRDFGRPMLPH